ncbi:Odorant receptor 64 [Cephus cinctus]|uniref:Odorant receptor n=1 Tax=Cephus cinctus TaxID=211228 RepID=S5TD86_CEPCN|nr:odorant receptor 13a-like [Cephus cinctus]AGS43062.1 odorant receptor Or3c [Cephus cinctus]ARN17883.1 odorant receptor 5 [Cephus cinctus]RLZ02131.1 Odorant receptor 64 [Cephus cinctus]
MHHTMSNTREKDPDTSFLKYADFHINLLRKSGFYSMKGISNKINKEPTIWEVLLVLTISTCGFFIIILEFRSVAVSLGSDTGFVIAVLSGTLTATLSMSKGLTILTSHREVRELLLRLSGFWEKSIERPENVDVMVQMANRASYLSKCYAATVVIMCSSYCMNPYVSVITQFLFTKTANNSYNFTATTFPTVYPFDLSYFPKYVVWILFEQAVCLLMTLHWIACDTLFPMCATHLAIQFQILRRDLERTTEVDELREIVKKQIILFQSCDILENIFSPIIFLTIIMTSTIMCACIFQFEKTLSCGVYLEIIKYVTHMMSLFVEILIYCGFSNVLSDQTELLYHAAYNSEWTDRSKKYKSIIYFLILRSQKPFQCTAYHFFPVGLVQITTILTTAVSYFTLLKTVTSESDDKVICS